MFEVEGCNFPLGSMCLKDGGDICAQAAQPLLAQGPPLQAPARRADGLPSQSASLLIHDAALVSWRRVCSSLDKTTKDCFLRSCELLGQVHLPFLQSALAFVEPATSGDKLLAHDSALWAGPSCFLSTGPWWTDGPVKCPGILSTVTGKFHSFKGKNKIHHRLHLWN